MGGAAERNFPLCSPALIISSIDLSRNVSFPSTLLIHNIDDTTVPFTSSFDFADVLSKGRVSVLTYSPKGGHIDIIIRATADGAFLESELASVIKKYAKLDVRCNANCDLRSRL
jgi:hypothetical protein